MISDIVNRLCAMRTQINELNRAIEDLMLEVCAFPTAMKAGPADVIAMTAFVFNVSPTHIRSRNKRIKENVLPRWCAVWCMVKLFPDLHYQQIAEWVGVKDRTIANHVLKSCEEREFLVNPDFKAKCEKVLSAFSVKHPENPAQMSLLPTETESKAA